MQPTGVPDGMALHLNVPSNRWGLSLGDLRSFRRRVRAALDDGTLRPTQCDGFDPADNTIGPDVYTVVEQLIKPVTARAGNMSWALMLHTEGLQCDIFVTHCWSEGIFEFVDKVTVSWPWGARGAYCCMFANPQNLDIAALISSPRHSPFAVALSGAHSMMVVPNLRVSIYSRVWCAYEAFLAYEQSKTIFMAATPRPYVWLRALRDFAFFLALVTIYLSVALRVVDWENAVSELDWENSDLIELSGGSKDRMLLQWLLLLSVSICALRAPASTPYSRQQRALMLAGFVGMATILSGFLRLFAFTVTHEASFDTRHRAVYWRVSTLYLAIMVLAGGIALSALEVDNTWSELRERENLALQRGYSGRLRDAECSVPADKAAILQELSSSGCEAAADQAVRVLIESGISTPRLRRVVELVGDLRKAGYWNLSYLMLGLVVWVFASFRYVLQGILLYSTHTLYRMAGAADRCECLLTGSSCAAAGACTADPGGCAAPGAGSHCLWPPRNPIFLMCLASTLMGLAWVWTFRRTHPDLRRFAGVTMGRISLFTFAMGCLCNYRTNARFQESDLAGAIRLPASLLIYALLALGPARLAGLPVLGRALVRFCFADLGGY